MKKDVFKFGESIKVGFRTFDADEEARSRYYVGLYSNKFDSEFENLSLSSWLCGDSSCRTDNTTVFPAKGNIKFSAEDPDHDYHGEFPPNDGKYEVCLVDEVGFLGDLNPHNTSSIALQCKTIYVKSIRNIASKKSLVKVEKERYAFNETIKVIFKAKVLIPKMWIGIFNSTDVVGKDELRLEDEISWLYTGCNNQSGDQSENNDCAALGTKKKGKVFFEEKNVDKYDSQWPIPLGTYRICLVFAYNSPYKKKYFKCSDKDTIVE